MADDIEFVNGLIVKAPHQNAPDFVKAEIRVAEAKTDAEELSRLRILYDELLMAVGNKYPGETRHKTALRYIRTAEIPVSGQAKDCGHNAEITGG